MKIIPLGTSWSDINFKDMSWHDCTIHSMAQDQDGEYQSDLVLDLDYIVEWIKTDDSTFQFHVAPALLRFQNVDKLNIQLMLHFKQEIVIHSIDCAPKEDKGFQNHHWTIKIQSYSNENINRIEFDAIGFVQELTTPPIIIESQSLTRQQREEMKNRNSKKSFISLS